MDPHISPKEQYRSFTKRLLENEAWRTLSEDEEDALRDKMDPIWWAMSEEERAEADAWLVAQRARAPNELGLIELSDSVSGFIHRGATAA